MVAVVVVVDEGRLPLKLTHIRPWVLPDRSGGGVGWICRSFRGPLIFRMGFWSGQSEGSEKYSPVRQRTGSSYQWLRTVRDTPNWGAKNMALVIENENPGHAASFSLRK